MNREVVSSQDCKAFSPKQDDFRGGGDDQRPSAPTRRNANTRSLGDALDQRLIILFLVGVEGEGYL